MGASCWSYFVPYESDIAAAFSRLQHDVFARRQFYAAKDATFSSIEELRDVQVEDGTHSILDMRRVVAEPFSPPLSREMELSMLLSGSEVFPVRVGGTARDASEQVAHGTVVRMTDDELIECFSTTTPGRTTIEKNEDKVYDLCERESGRYAFVFDADRPAIPIEIYFAGVSGD